MKPRHQVSRNAIELVKTFEGYRRASARLADGRWTIGYGHTKTAREGVEISEADAEALLIYDLRETATEIDGLVFAPLTQNQYDALVAFTFSVGVDNLKASLVLTRLNEGALLQAAFAMEMWRKAEFDGHSIVVDALVRRRAAEKALFLTPPDGFVPAPSQVLTPKIDYDAAIAQPVQTPMNVVVPLEGDLAEAQPELPLPPPQEPAYSSTAAAVDAITAQLQALIPEIEGEAIEPEVLAALDAPVDEAASAPESSVLAEVDPILMPAAETPSFREDGPILAAEDHPPAPAVTMDEDDGVVIGPMGVQRKAKATRKGGGVRVLPYGVLFAMGIGFFFAGVFIGQFQQQQIGWLVALLGALMGSVGLYYLLAPIDPENRA